MARYYISDCHFGHSGMNFRMDNRGFSSVEEMDEYMINQWNSRVRKNDEVVILGDLTLQGPEKANEILRRLNGKKMLVIGNHDKFVNRPKFDKSLLVWAKGYAEMHDNGRKVVCCHYPIMTYDGQFHRNKNGEPLTWMLHGHTHLTQDTQLIEVFKETVRNFPRVSRGNDIPTPAPVQIINCFCMLSDYIPLTLDEWIELENSGVIKERIQNDWTYDNRGGNYEEND